MAGFGIVNKIREFCKKSFNVLVPFKALSCGTLICLGADEIIMTEMGTLSPIDPSVTSEYNPVSQNPLMPGVPGAVLPMSVEDVAAYINLAKSQAQINNLENIFLKLAEKVHPLALGRVYRAREQITMLGTKLLGSCKQKLNPSETDRIVNYLSRELGSHDYEISRTEAKEKLKKVKDASADLGDLMWKLYLAYRDLMELDITFDPDQIVGVNPQVNYTAYSAVIESATRLDYFEQSWDMRRVRIPQPGQPGQPGLLVEGVQQKVLKAGWTEFKN